MKDLRPPSCENACRPLRERRAEAILDAAEALFMEQGYDGTSLAEIVKHSGGSLATLYQLFGNKQGLLHAIAARWRDQTNRLTVKTDISPERSRTAILVDFGLELVERFNSPRAVALMKMLVSECLRDRDFALQTYQDLHLPLIAKIADEFRDWNEQGLGHIDEPDEAARLFLAIISGDSMMGKLTGVDDGLLSEQQIRWRLKPFVTYFALE